MAVLDSPRAAPAAPARSRTRRLPPLGTIVATGMVAAAALLPVVQSTLATTTGYETQRLEQQRNDLQASVYQRQTEIAELGALQRIDREARERLRMVPSTGGIAITVGRPAPLAGEVPARYLPAEDDMPGKQVRRDGWLERLTAWLGR